VMKNYPHRIIYSDIANENEWRHERVVGRDKSTRNTGQKRLEV
jgi:hypothetical protein